jgi:D-alanyl-D-alanine carboxypeptidase
MRQESGGQEDVISWAGAMGLMQVMPDTYDALRGRYNLGADPFDPHNNILAGTAYLREMYDRFGAPGFLAAYNAGPNRLDLYLSNGTPLPEETVSYVAAIAPLLGPGTPMSGPLAVYGGSSGYAIDFASHQTAGGCDTDAAFDPRNPCQPVHQPAIQPAVYVAAYSSDAGCDADAAYDPTRQCAPVRASTGQSVASAAAAPAPGRTTHTGCDPDGAYDPTRPCDPTPVAAPVPSSPFLAQAPRPPLVEAARPDTNPQAHYATSERRPLQETSVQRGAFIAPTSTPVPGEWGIQVGAFANLATAQAAAESARTALPELLRTATTELPATTPFGGKIAFRARLVGLSPTAATNACSRLSGQGLPCMTVPPTNTY